MAKVVVTDNTTESNNFNIIDPILFNNCSRENSAHGGRYRRITLVNGSTTQGVRYSDVNTMLALLCIFSWFLAVVEKQRQLTRNGYFAIICVL
jgi:hypothetical protein